MSIVIYPAICAHGQFLRLANLEPSGAPAMTTIDDGCRVASCTEKHDGVWHRVASCADKHDACRVFCLVLRSTLALCMHHPRHHASSSPSLFPRYPMSVEP